MDLGFSSGLKIFSEISLRLLSSFGLGWITLNPLRRQVLHNHCKSVMQCRLLRTLWSAVTISPHFSIWILSARSSGFLLHGALAPFVCLQTSQFWTWRKWENKCWFPPGLFDKGFSDGCAEGGRASGGIPTSRGNTSVELEDHHVYPSVSGWSQSRNSVSTLGSWSPTTPVCFRSFETFGLVFGCNVVVGFTLDVSPMIDETWWLTWLSCIRTTVFLTLFSKRKYRGWFFQWLNSNKHVQIIHIFGCFLKRMSSHICSHNKSCTLRLLNRVLFFLGQISFTHHMKWSSRGYKGINSLLPSSHWRGRSIARGNWLKEPMSDLRIWTLRSVHVLVKNPGCFSRCFFHAQSPFDRSFLEGRSVLILVIFGSCLHDSKCRSQFSFFQNIPVREMTESHSELGLAIRLNLS